MTTKPKQMEHIVYIREGFAQSGFISLPERALSLPMEYIGLLAHITKMGVGAVPVAGIPGMRWVDGSDEEAWHGHVQNVADALLSMRDGGFLEVRLREVGAYQLGRGVQAIDIERLTEELKR